MQIKSENLKIWFPSLLQIKINSFKQSMGTANSKNNYISEYIYECQVPTNGQLQMQIFSS